MRWIARRLRPWLPVCAAVWLAAPAAADPLFPAHYLSYDVHPYPGPLALTDLNGDGRLDLVVANSIEFNGFVSVLLGNRATGFGAETDFANGTRGHSMVLGDLNGDGRTDVAVETGGVLLGLGDGGFDRAPDFPTGPRPTAIAMGDLNGDGNQDLAVLTDIGNPVAGGAVSVSLGHGDGTFDHWTDSRVGRYPQSLAICDLNGDGRLDITVANRNLGIGSISVLLGVGDGTFAPETECAQDVSLAPGEMQVGDLNGDAKVDLVLVNSADNLVAVLLGDGHGGFRSRLEFGAGINIVSVAIADVNLDGVSDLVAVNANYYDGAISVLLGLGNGLFGPPRTFAAGIGPRYVAIADVDADGKPDAAVAALNSETIDVLPGHGDGTFGVDVDLESAPASSSWVLADWNSDGIADLAAPVGIAADAVAVLLGFGDGTFRHETDFPVGEDARSIAAGDLNGDGHPDIAVANRLDNTVSVLYGNGAGSFGPRTACTVVGGPVGLVLADWNRDGRLDFATTNESGTVSIALGHAGGGFETPAETSVGILPVSPAAADLNRDGNADLVVLNSHSNTVSVLLGHGDGTFGPDVQFDAGAFPRSVAIGDLNGDGWPDLAIAGATVSLLLARGAGDFGPRMETPVGDGPGSVCISDLNTDGKLDLVLANGFDDTVSLLLGWGDGTFSPKQDYGVGIGPSFLVIGDLNRDDLPDLVVARRPPKFGLSVLLNLGVPTPVLLQDFAIASEVDGIALTWRTAAPMSPEQFALNGACGSEQWSVAIEPLAEARSFAAHDRNAAISRCGGDVTYSLWSRDAAGSWVLLARQSLAQSRGGLRTELFPAFPNPFHGSVTIPFALARAGAIRMDVYDAAGRAVATIVRGTAATGRGVVTWDGCDARGRPVAAGIYMVRFVSSAGTRVQRVVVVR